MPHGPLGVRGPQFGKHWSIANQESILAVPSFIVFNIRNTVIMWRYRSPGPFDLRPWCLPPLFGWTRPSAPRIAFCPGGPIDRESAELVFFGFCCRSDRSISTIAGLYTLPLDLMSSIFC